MPESLAYPRGFLVTVTWLDFAIRAWPPAPVKKGLAAFLTGHLAPASALGMSDRLEAGYRADGPMLSGNLLGQYAAVVIDFEKRQVLLAQDSLGVRKLYYRVEANALWIASHLELLIAATGRPPLDERYFAWQLATGRPPRDRTPFRGIEALSGGASLIFNGRTCAKHHAWRPQTDRIILPQHEEEELRCGLDAAVKASLPDAGMVVCEMSGGLDSSSVLATAARLGSNPIALTFVSPSGRAGDDDAYARIGVEHMQVPWATIDLDAVPLRGEESARFFGESGGELHAGVQRAYTEVLEALGADVVLSGGGGDIVFGYGGLLAAHLGDALARGDLGGTLRACRWWAAERGGARATTHYLLAQALPAASRYLLRRSQIPPIQPPPDWISARFLSRAGVNVQRPPQRTPRVEGPGAQYLWELVFEYAAQCNISFRQSLGAELRFPLLHRPFVEAMLSISPRRLYRDGMDRSVQRRALADRLPKSILERTTKGSAQELNERSLAADQLLWARLEQPRLAELGWIDADRWRVQVARARVGVFDGSISFDVTLLTELWLDGLERFAPPPAPAMCDLPARLS